MGTFHPCFYNALPLHLKNTPSRAFYDSEAQAVKIFLGVPTSVLLLLYKHVLSGVPHGFLGEG